MDLTAAFNAIASIYPIAARTMRAARMAPFSLRMTSDERARLEAEARGVPLGTYMKAKLLDDAPIRLRRPGVTVQDRPALAQALALLGRSHMASNLNQLAYAANIGVLAVTPDVEADLRDALNHVRLLRSVLLTALGLKDEALP